MLDDVARRFQELGVDLELGALCPFEIYFKVNLVIL